MVYFCLLIGLAFFWDLGLQFLHHFPSCQSVFSSTSHFTSPPPLLPTWQMFIILCMLRITSTLYLSFLMLKGLHRLWEAACVHKAEKHSFRNLQVIDEQRLFPLHSTLISAFLHRNGLIFLNKLKFNQIHAVGALSTNSL